MVDLSWDPRQSYAARARHRRSLEENIHVQFTVKVDGVTYARVLNDEGEKEYDVMVDESGRGACGCPDFRIRCRALGVPCKHLFAFRCLIEG